MRKSPIFIIGNPRSGTTLLRLLLHAHSNISIPPEAGFALWLYKKYIKYSSSNLESYLEDMRKTKKIDNWNLCWDHLKKKLVVKSPESYSELIDLIYQFYGNSIGKQNIRWGDKNNFYLNYIDQIKMLFPDAFFIHVIRDGRNVACSYVKLSKKNFKSPDAPKLPHKISEIAKEWNNNLNTIRNSFNKFNYENVKEIRLEDLTDQPKRTIIDIMKFIRERYEENVLEFYKLNDTNGGEPSHYLIGWKEKNTKPIQAESKDKYKIELTNKEIKSFNRIAGKNLYNYNYTL